MIGKMLGNALGYAGRTETTVLLEEPEALNTESIQGDEKQPRQKRNAPGRDSSCSRTGHDWTVVRPDAR
jgi:hypothetical protein